MKAKKVEYNVYSKLSGKNLEKLNLSICENTKIFINIPIEINDNVDKYNTSSGYFNDICYPTTSDDDTDISLQDRKNEYAIVKTFNFIFIFLNFFFKKFKKYIKYKLKNNKKTQIGLKS